MKKDDIKNEDESDYGDYETNKKASAKIHEQVKELGYDYILEKLKQYGFSEPEKLADKLLKDKTDSHNL
ncbi:MAG: hypothetical protein WCG45_01170 [bacterium]